MYEVYFLDGSVERFETKEFSMKEGMYFLGSSVIPIVNVKFIRKVK